MESKGKLLCWTILTLLVGGFVASSMLSGTKESYEAYAPGTFEVKALADVGPVTRITISPDGQIMLAATLTGEVRAFTKNEQGQFQLQTEPFFTVDLGFEGLPDESGLTGLVFGADFDTSGDVFLLYGHKVDDTTAENRVMRVTLTQENGIVTGEDPENIFTANVPQTTSHQIQNGIGVLVEEKPHLLFAIGEGFEADRSQDQTKEAGKLLLIQRDGTNPVGSRPYPANPKVQAIGVRNTFDMDIDPFDPTSRVALADTGVIEDDRLIYLDVLDQDSNGSGPLNLGWDGSDESLAKSIPDLGTPGAPEAVLQRWAPTFTVTGLAFYDDASLVPKADEDTSYVLIATYGKTQSTEATPDKTISLGIISHRDTQPRLTLYPLVRRAAKAHGQPGNIVGLEVDPTTKSFYFGDIVEGKVYQVDPLKVDYSL